LANYPGGTVITIAMNPNNYKQVFVSDLNNKVWGSADEGATWSNMTLNWASLTSLVTTIEVFSPDATLANTVVIGGGFGLFQVGATGTTWTRLTGFDDNVPPALVLDLHYDYTDSVLVAGTLGPRVLDHRRALLWEHRSRLNREKQSAAPAQRTCKQPSSSSPPAAGTTAERERATLADKRQRGDDDGRYERLVARPRAESEAGAAAATVHLPFSSSCRPVHSRMAFFQCG